MELNQIALSARVFRSNISPAADSFAAFGYCRDPPPVGPPLVFPSPMDTCQPSQRNFSTSTLRV